MFGDSEAALRALSAAAGVATIPVVWFAGRVLGGREAGDWVGTTAAALFALAPVHLQYAQEARRFALVTLAMACAIAALLWLMAHPAASRQPVLGWRGAPDAEARGARRAWLALVAGLAASAWTDNLTALAIAALGLGALHWLWRDLRWDRAALANLALAGGAVALLWSPYLPSLLAQADKVGQAFWIPPPGWRSIERTAEFLFSVRFLKSPPTFAPFLALAVVGLGALVWRGRSGAALLLVAAAALPFALSLLVSVTFKPIFLDRTLLWTTVPFYLLLASAILLIPRRPWLRGGVVGLLACLSLAGVVRYFDDFKKEPWRQVVRGISADWQPGDLLVLVPRFQARLVNHYAARENRQLRLFLPSAAGENTGTEEGGDEGASEGGAGDGKAGARLSPYAVMDADVAALQASLVPDGRVWVLSRGLRRYDPDEKVRRLLEGQGRPLLREDKVTRNLMRLHLFGPASPAR